MRALALALLVLASPAQAERVDAGRLAFDAPDGWKAEAATDVVAESAARLTPPELGKTRVTSLLVLGGGKKLGDGELESESAAWHAAHQRNRAAWGVRSDGGLPRDALKIGGRRAVRYRDKAGSQLGATERTFTCLLAGTHLACVLASAAPASRDEADRLSAQILASLAVRKK